MKAKEAAKVTRKRGGTKIKPTPTPVPKPKPEKTMKEIAAEIEDDEDLRDEDGPIEAESVFKDMSIPNSQQPWYTTESARMAAIETKIARLAGQRKAAGILPVQKPWRPEIENSSVPLLAMPRKHER